MLKFLSGRSKNVFVDQAKTCRTDIASVKSVADGMLEAGQSFTLIRGRGSDVQVFPGDFTATADRSTGGPVLVLEYKKSHHAAYVKNASGEIMMMLVREKAEDAWFDGSRKYVSLGGQTEGRLYLNGTPVGVNFSDVYMDVAPRVTSEERSQTGASLVELVKERQGNSIRLFKRKGNGEKGEEIAAFTKLRQGTGSLCVFSLQKTDVVDPVVCLVMAWFTATVDYGHYVDPSAKDVASV